MPDRTVADDVQEAPACFTIDNVKRRADQASPARTSDKVPPQIFAMMAVTTLLTFGTLTSGYTLLF
jgi:hypothetical protein